MLRNLTISAEADLIDRARARARSEGTTLTDELRQWLTQYASEDAAVARFRATLSRLGHVDAGRKFNRDELNER